MKSRFSTFTKKNGESSQGLGYPPRCRVQPPFPFMSQDADFMFQILDLTPETRPFLFELFFH
jgi:hypothetical protein